MSVGFFLFGCVDLLVLCVFLVCCCVLLLWFVSSVCVFLFLYVSQLFCGVLWFCFCFYFVGVSLLLCFCLGGGVSFVWIIGL